MATQGLSKQVSEELDRFLEPFSKGLKAPVVRLVRDMVRGMLAGGKVLLSAMVRETPDGTTLGSREKRFSTLLASRHWDEQVPSEGLLAEGAGRLGRRTLILVDISEMAKPYARKMEHLAWVRDGSQSRGGQAARLVPGYWLLEAYGR